MKIIDFERKGNLVRFYLGKDKVSDYTGDGWRKRPYCDEAGLVSEKYVSGLAEIVFPFDSLVLEPCSGGQVQSANEVGQLFIVLNDTEQVNKVTVVVVQDFSLCTRFSEEDFRTSHTRFNVDDVLRHDSQDRVDDATLISCVGQRACRCRQ